MSKTVKEMPSFLGREIKRESASAASAALSKLADNIDSHLTWGNTAQGHCYWGAVEENLRAMARELEKTEEKKAEDSSAIVLKVGGKYKTRGGGTIAITSKYDDDGSYPFKPDEGLLYTPRGTFWSDGAEHIKDIVEEVKDAVGLKMQVELNGKKYKLVEME